MCQVRRDQMLRKVALFSRKALQWETVREIQLCLVSHIFNHFSEWKLEKIKCSTPYFGIAEDLNINYLYLNMNK